MKSLFIKSCIALALCCALSSCTEKFVEINTNPNKINFGDAAPTSLFEPLLYGLGVNNQYQAWFFANELVQVTAFTSGQTTQIHQYQVTDGNWQNQWDNYARFGFDAHHLVAQAVSREDKYMEALGLILKVYCLSNLSALFGDIPYKEAYMQTENTAPVFDSQEELAAEFIADLDSAAVILKRKPEVTKPGLDRMYGDNYTKWIKFANSLKLRILCRMSGMGDSYWASIQQVIDNPTAYPVFADNSDNATIPFGDVDPYRNYWGQQNMTSANFTNHRITQTMIDMMVEFNDKGNALFEDPRLPIYATQRSGAWKGSRGGVTSQEFKAYDTGSALPNFAILARSSMPAFLMDYSEVLFILAEGAEKGKLTVPGKTAKDLYEEAVRASIAKWAEFGQYASSPSRCVPRTSRPFSPALSGLTTRPYRRREAATAMRKSSSPARSSSPCTSAATRSITNGAAPSTPTSRSPAAPPPTITRCPPATVIPTTPWPPTARTSPRPLSAWAAQAP